MPLDRKSAYVALIIAVIITFLSCTSAKHEKEKSEVQNAGHTFVGLDFEDDGFSEDDGFLEDAEIEKRSQMMSKTDTDDEDDSYDEMYEPMTSQRKNWMARNAECIPKRGWCRFRESECCGGMKCRKYKTDRDMFLSYWRCQPYYYTGTISVWYPEAVS